MKRITGECLPRCATQARKVELLQREVLELVYQYRPEVGLIQPRDCRNVKEALCVPEKVVIVELVRLLACALDLLGQFALPSLGSVVGEP